MRKPYATQPGTIPHRAVEALKALGPGAELSNAELADQLDVNPFSLIPCLAIPRKRGALKARRDETRHGWPVMWSIGNGIPEPVAQDPEDGAAEDDPPKPKIVASDVAQRVQTSAFPGLTAATVNIPESIATNNVAIEVQKTRAPGYFYCGLDLQGNLIITDGEEEIRFSAVKDELIGRVLGAPRG